MSKFKIEGNPNIGVMGDHARVSGVNQYSGFQMPDLMVLARELSELRAALSERAQTAEHASTVEHVAKAEEAARQGDESAVLQRLKQAGAWALSVATEIGKDAAAKVITQQLGGS